MTIGFMDFMVVTINVVVVIVVVVLCGFEAGLFVLLNFILTARNGENFSFKLVAEWAIEKDFVIKSGCLILRCEGLNNFDLGLFELYKAGRFLSLEGVFEGDEFKWLSLIVDNAILLVVNDMFFFE